MVTALRFAMYVFTIMYASMTTAVSLFVDPGLSPEAGSQWAVLLLMLMISESIRQSEDAKAEIVIKYVKEGQKTKSVFDK